MYKHASDGPNHIENELYETLRSQQKLNYIMGVHHYAGWPDLFNKRPMGHIANLSIRDGNQYSSTQLLLCSTDHWLIFFNWVLPILIY